MESGQRVKIFYWPEHSPAVSGQEGEDARAEITTGIDRISTVHAEALADHGHYKTAEQRAEVVWYIVSLIADRRHTAAQDTRSHDLKHSDFFVLLQFCLVIAC